MTDTPSDRGQRIARCASCKVALWSNYLITNQGEHQRFLRVGTLDDPSLMPPGVHIHSASNLPWYIILDETPAADVFYDQKTTWPQDSLQRLKALCERTGAPYK